VLVKTSALINISVGLERALS